eukprot:3836004-Amphidinium_carterae.1
MPTGQCSSLLVGRCQVVQRLLENHQWNLLRHDSAAALVAVAAADSGPQSGWCSRIDGIS